MESYLIGELADVSIKLVKLSKLFVLLLSREYMA